MTRISTSRNLETQELLLSAAKKIFAERGYSGATVKDIASEAGVNISLISYHFKGKDGLYRACLEPFGKARLAFAERILTSPESLNDMKTKLRLWAEHFLECHIEEQEVTTILHRECVNDRQVTRELFENTFLKIFQTLVKFVASAKKQDLLRDDVDPHIAAGLFYGSLIHIGRTDKLQQEFFGKSITDPKYRNQIIEHAVQTLLKGIA